MTLMPFDPMKIRLGTRRDGHDNVYVQLVYDGVVVDEVPIGWDNDEGNYRGVSLPTDKDRGRSVFDMRDRS